MANFIIKPASSDDLLLQNDGGTTVVSIPGSGNPSISDDAGNTIATFETNTLNLTDKTLQRPCIRDYSEYFYAISGTQTDSIAAPTTNGDLSLSANGTGQVKINGDDSSNSFTLPDGRGLNTQVLQTNGSGDTSWTSISALSTVDNIVATSAQNINGTVSEQTVKFGDTFTVNGTLTINSDLVLSNVLAKTSAMTITNSSAQTVTGDGGATLTGHHALFT